VSDHYPVDVLIQSTLGPVRVGAFNIKTFGQAKVGNQDVLDILVKVVLISFVDYVFNIDILYSVSGSTYYLVFNVLKWYLNIYFR